MPPSVRLIERIRDDFRRLAAGKPGSRFLDHHRHLRQREPNLKSTWKTAAYIAAGVLLLVAGLVLSIPPGLPGFLLWLPGLGLLVARLRPFALVLDKSELQVRRAWFWISNHVDEKTR